MATTTRFTLTLLEEAQSNGHITANTSLVLLDALVGGGVKDKDLSAEPGSPSDGDVYILPSGSLTGATWSTWSSTENDLAVYYQGWYQISLNASNEGLAFYLQDEDKVYRWSGSAWAEVVSASGMQDFVLPISTANVAGETNFPKGVYRNSKANVGLAYNDSTNETAIFESYLPSNYNGGGLTIDLYWAAATATSGDVIWEAAIERQDIDSHDLDADGFASNNANTDTAPSTSGQLSKATITFTDGADMDSLAAGECFRLKVYRRAGDAGDTMTGDAELYRVVVRES